MNPRIVEFDPSPDHSNLTPDSQPMVTRYDLGFYLVGAAQPFQVVDMGKPTPGVDGRIAVDFSTRLASWPLANGDYVARVTAVGPTGVGQSDLSNAFSFLTCTYAIVPVSATIAAGGGGTAVTLTAPAGCAWTAASGATWLTLSSVGGSGSASLTLTAAANTGTTPRSATATIGGLAFTVTQPGTCAYAVSPTAQTLSASAANGTIGVTAGFGCAWTASSESSWLTVSPASGSGSGSVAYAASANTTATSRSATATVAGRAVTFTQSGTCAFTLSASSYSFAVAGGTATITLTSSVGCAWTASSAASWVTVSPTSGSGTASVAFTAAPNTTSASRVTTLTIGGQSFSVVQSATARPLRPSKVRILIRGN